MTTSFYELDAPTEWAGAPELWSSTSLDDVRRCPRRWQLARSRWGDLERFPVRSHPAAVEGQLIHEALDRLTRACGRHGNPPIGSPEFASALTDGEFFEGLGFAVDAWQRQVTSHPRPGPVFKLRSTAQELANRAIRLFREQYRPGTGGFGRAASTAPVKISDLSRALIQWGALSELRLQHPDLPFMGILDRVQLDSGGAVEIIDFKTGRASDAHEQQLLRYAVLWWRATQTAPARVHAQYLEGSRTWVVTPSDLARVEAGLGDLLRHFSGQLTGRPAPATPGTGCRWCPVRARCDAGWGLAEQAARAEGRGDAELTVVGEVTTHGVLAKDLAGHEVAIVYEPAVASLLPSLVPGRRMRVLDGVLREKGKEIEIKAWTEVFVLGSFAAGR
ncbi:MAG: PD-(D/E)XK nuclease family protein [Myxococcota bacterium]